jgi:hypothetical protein
VRCSHPHTAVRSQAPTVACPVLAPVLCVLAAMEPAASLAQFVAGTPPDDAGVGGEKQQEAPPKKSPTKKPAAAPVPAAAAAAAAAKGKAKVKKASAKKTPVDEEEEEAEETEEIEGEEMEQEEDEELAVSGEEKEEEVAKKRPAAAAMKRPAAAAELASPSHKFCKKRPAAALQPAKETTEDQKQPAASIQLSPKRAEVEEEQAEAEGINRDRCLARKFRNLLEDLPDVVQSAWKEASQAPSGERRKRETRVIAEALKRDKQGKIVTTTDTPFFHEHKARMEKRYMNKFSAGCIREEAETKVGGSLALLSAVQEGRVKIAKEDGLELYFFPNVQMGKEESFTASQGIESGKSTTGRAGKELGDLVDSLGWTLDDVQSSSQSSKPPLEDCIGRDTIEKMTTSVAQFSKAIKVTGQVVEEAGKCQRMSCADLALLSQPSLYHTPSLPETHHAIFATTATHPSCTHTHTPTQRRTTVLDGLYEQCKRTLMESQVVHDDLHQWSRYQRTRTGEVVTTAMAKSQLETAAGLCQQLFDMVKGIRVMLPSKAKMANTPNAV